MIWIAVKLSGEKWIAFEQRHDIYDYVNELKELDSISRLFVIPNCEDEDEAILVAKLLDKAVIELRKNESGNAKLERNGDELTVKIILNGQPWAKLKSETEKLMMGEFLKRRLKQSNGNISELSRKLCINRKTTYRLLTKYEVDRNN